MWTWKTKLWMKNKKFPIIYQRDIRGIQVQLITRARRQTPIISFQHNFLTWKITLSFMICELEKQNHVRKIYAWSEILIWISISISYSSYVASTHNIVVNKHEIDIQLRTLLLWHK